MMVPVRMQEWVRSSSRIRKLFQGQRDRDENERELPLDDERLWDREEEIDEWMNTLIIV